MEWDPIVGVPIRDVRDGVGGWVLRRYGAAFSALMDDGTVRYYLIGGSGFAVDRRNTQPGCPHRGGP